MKKVNKKFAIGLIMIAGLVVMFVFGLMINAQDEPEVKARITQILGGAVYYKCEVETDDEWTRARVGTPIYQNCFCQTTESAQATLNFTPEVELNMLESSEIYIGTINAEIVELSLKNGSLLNELEPLRELIQEYHVNSVSSNAGVRGTEFMINYKTDTNTLLVNKGSVEFSNNYNHEYNSVVGEGKAVRTSSLGKPSDPVDIPEKILFIFDDEEWAGQDDGDWGDDWDFDDYWDEAWADWEEDFWNNYDQFTDNTWDTEEWDDFMEDMVEDGIWEDISEWDEEWMEEDGWFDEQWNEDDWGDYDDWEEDWNEWDDWNNWNDEEDNNDNDDNNNDDDNDNDDNDDDNDNDDNNDDDNDNDDNDDDNDNDDD